MTPRRRPVAALAVGLLIAASCSGSADVVGPDPTLSNETSAPIDPDGAATPVPTATPVPDPVGRAKLPDDATPVAGDRLAIQTADGQIVSALPDGSDLIALTDPDEGTQNDQATWSSDANRLAWVTTDPATGRARVRAARIDGSGWTDTEVPSAPFYLAWDATGSQIATLAPGSIGLDLGIVDLREDPGFSAIDAGSPLFFSWGPDADAILVHASGFRLDLVPLDDRPPRVLEPTPGSFQAPVWLGGPTPLIYADMKDGNDFLVVTGEDGGGRRALVTYDGYLQYVVSPQSGLIALRVLDEAFAPRPEVVTASAQSDPFVDAIDAVGRDQLTLMAVFGGEPTVLYPTEFDFEPGPVRAFYWNAAGNALAWLVEIDPGDGNCDSETMQLEWRFWDSGSVLSGPGFIPTGVFACEYLPFFDQYGQSATYWSPDGTQIVYAGRDVASSERGIFVTAMDGSDAELVAPGEHAVWSPSLAGSAAGSSL